MRCKICKKEVGEFWSELDTHLWKDHEQVQLKHLEQFSLPSQKERYECTAPIFAPHCSEPYSKEKGCLTTKPCGYKKTLAEIEGI
jgi:hypothetical protein